MYIFKNLSASSLPCWGYEDRCDPDKSFQRPVCLGSHKGWVKTKDEQLSAFFSQADFGYVRAQRNSIQVMCEPTFLVNLEKFTRVFKRLTSF